MSDKILVPAWGAENPRIMFVGEAPGKDEVIARRPFVGPAGKVLHRMLNQAGIPVSSCRFTNVVKERPERNNISLFVNFGRSKVTTTEAYDRYEQELLDELRGARPNVAVAVGKTALWALCRRTDITKARGSILESATVPGLKVIPILHPSFVMRGQWEWWNVCVHDLRRILDESGDPAIHLPERDLIINPTATDALEYISRCARAGLCAFDIEVVGSMEVSHVSLSYDPKSAIAIRFDLLELDEEVTVWKALNELLSNEAIAKVIQNGIFDTTFLYTRYGIWTRNVHDTMIAATFLHPDLPRGLDFLASIYTREPYYKDDGKTWKLGPREAGDQFSLYSAKDAAVTLEIWLAMQEDLDKIDARPHYEWQRRLIEPLVYMSDRGVKVNEQALNEERKRLSEQREKLRREICERTGVDNPASTKQLQYYFYVERGARPYVNRNSGSWRLDEEALKGLSVKGFEEARMILEFRRLSKLISTYLDVTLRDGRLVCSYNPVGSRQGRLSSGQNIFGEGTNMQNLPKDVRQFLVADPGWLLIQCDLAQAENRVVAYIAPEPRMIEAFESGADIHSRTAALIFGIPEDEVSREPGSADIGDGKHSQRDWGKRANHALNYAMGARRFSQTHEIQYADAKRIRDSYLAAYPGVANMWRWIEDKVRRERVLRNVFGRPYVFLGQVTDSTLKQAYSYIPQSTVADLLNRRGLLFLWENFFDEVDLLMQVHDSVVFQVRKDLGARRIAEILQALRASVEAPLEFRGMKFSIPLDAEAGYNLRDLKGLNWNDLEHDIEELLKEDAE